MLTKGHAVFQKTFALVLGCASLVLCLAHAAEAPVIPKKPVVTDANRNGVLDHVETFIQENYYPTKSEQDAAQQWSRALEAAVAVDKADKDQMKIVALQSARAKQCVQDVFLGLNNSKTPELAMQEIRVQTLNTRARLKAYRTFLRSAHHRIHPNVPLKGSVCERKK